MRTNDLVLRIVVIMSLPFLLATNCENIREKVGQKESTKINAAVYDKISISQETAKMGMFDPAIEYEKGGKVGWMVYTACEFPNQFTTLAKSVDNGQTWQRIKRLNSPVPDKVDIRGTVFDGLWRNEVATLVNDPGDKGAEWKLFSHKYFIKAPYKDYKTGKPFLTMSIAYKSADSPEKLDSANEVILFGAGQFPFPPQKARVNLNALHSDLKDTVYYTEPGSLHKDGVLYLSLSTMGAKREHNKIILISSKDHAQSWKYVGTLVDYKDSDKFSSLMFTASSLVSVKGRDFLFAAPIRMVKNEGVHDGTYIFEFEDISNGKLKRDATGKLIANKYLKPSIESPNAGESDYDEYNTNGGIVMAQQDNSGLKLFKNPWDVEIFKIFNTKEKILE